MCQHDAILTGMSMDDLEVWFDKGVTDGLPVVPPTRERVERMLAGTALDRADLVGEVAPNYGRATVEKVAINAVMAGCRPEYLPVVLAAVEAACDPAFNLHGMSTSTHFSAPLIVVNGPIRGRVGLNCSFGVFGPGYRANATIGRALRLVMRNVGGSIPGAVSKSVFGQPGRVSLCFGEWEEKSPWEPFHVRRGFAREESVITAHCATGTQDIADIWAETGEELIWVLAHSIDWIGNNKVLVPQADGEMLLLLCPDFAHKIARDGLSIPDVQRMLHEYTRTPLERWHRNHWPKLEERGYVENGTVPLCAVPEQFLIAVAGGESGHHALNFCTFGLTWSVSVPFTLEPSATTGEFCELPQRP
jgi:hypothetical protein